MSSIVIVSKAFDCPAPVGVLGGSLQLSLTGLTSRLNLQCQVHTVAHHPANHVSAGQFLSYFLDGYLLPFLVYSSQGDERCFLFHGEKEPSRGELPTPAALLPVSPTCCQSPGGSVCFDLESILPFVCHLLLLFLLFKGLHSLLYHTFPLSLIIPVSKQNGLPQWLRW